MCDPKLPHLHFCHSLHPNKQLPIVIRIKWNNDIMWVYGQCYINVAPVNKTKETLHWSPLQGITDPTWYGLLCFMMRSGTSMITFTMMQSGTNMFRFIMMPSGTNMVWFIVMPSETTCLSLLWWQVAVMWSGLLWYQVEPRWVVEVNFVCIAADDEYFPILFLVIWWFW